MSPEGGRIGVVLPRSALAAKGGDEFRKRILKQAETVDLTMLVNNREWVFPNVHPQYTIGLTAITRREGGRESELRLRRAVLEPRAVPGWRKESPRDVSCPRGRGME